MSIAVIPIQSRIETITMNAITKVLSVATLCAVGVLDAGVAQAVTCGATLRPIISWTNGTNYYFYGQPDRSYAAPYYFYCTTTDPDFSNALQAAITGDKVVTVTGNYTAGTVCPSATSGARYYGTVISVSTYR
jgi:hypothetical protein